MFTHLYLLQAGAAHGLATRFGHFEMAAAMLRY